LGNDELIRRVLDRARSIRCFVDFDICRGQGSDRGLKSPACHNLSFYIKLNLKWLFVVKCGVFRFLERC